MDVQQAVDDFNDFVGSVETIELDNLSHPQAKWLSWSLSYLFFKVAFRLIYGGKIWDEVALLHNVISVMIGMHDLYFLDWEDSDTCYSLTDRRGFSIVIQLIHSITDFVAFLPEMWLEPIYFWHHFVLMVTSIVLPYCPGCYFVVIAYTLAEMGSASIAIDLQWRKAGKNSRGFKRVVIFGLTRVVNIYLLYRIYLVTPSKVFFTLSSETKEIFTMNVPICMITSVGGSIMMLLVNGVTWYRMYRIYMKQRKKRKAQKAAARKKKKQ